MPEPLERGRRYMPGLDGLRALAVLAVIAFHLGFGWAAGGLLGVAVFFTLSGYLITDLLLVQHASGMPLREFWLGRARRLLPALLAMLLIVSIWVWLRDPSQLATVRGQVLAGLVYMSNWWQSFQHISYFARFGPPSPLDHLWSLAVEEQFYLVWPWLLLAGLRLAPVRLRSARLQPRLAMACLLLAGCSALEMALLYRPGFDPSRVYYGTDTRAFGLLFGAGLACVWPSRPISTRVGRHAALILDIVGLTGLVAIAVMVWRTGEYSPFIYHGGLVLVSLFTVMALVALTRTVTRLSSVLGWGPLRWIGVRSYAIYLWHEPVIVLTTPNTVHGVQPLRALLQIAASIALAAISWRLLENPIRHGALGRIKAQLQKRRHISLRWTTAFGTVAASVLVAGLGLSGALASPRAQPPSTPLLTGGLTAPLSSAGGAGNAGAGSTRGSTRDASTSTAGKASGPGAKPPASGQAAPHSQSSTGGLKTSCQSVVHIGDSTSDGLVSNDYLPDPEQQIPAQYRRVGVKHSIMEITGGTSIVETIPGDVNARTVARKLVSDGYHGCWVLALGTNDTADIYVGSSVSLDQRIQEMMSTIGNRPVLWVNVKTLVSTGPYSESDMLKWNQALLAACGRYPNMRIYDWASAVKDSWFIPDGIHYYSDGYAARAHLIANALAEAFPASGRPSKSCVVSTPSLSIKVAGIH